MSQVGGSTELIRVLVADDGDRSGVGLRLPQAEAPSAVARRVIYIEPGLPCRGSGSLCGWGWVAEMSGHAAEGAHPLEKSAPDFGIQAFIAYLRDSDVLQPSPKRSSPKFDVGYSIRVLGSACLLHNV